MVDESVSAGRADDDELVEKYSALRPTYEAFTNNLQLLFEVLLRSKGIEYLAIERRTKEVKSFGDKIRRPLKTGKYDRVDLVTDLSGIRIIAYYQKDVREICQLIERNFSVDLDNSTDKNAMLAPDKFGYLSVHYIISHSKEREQLPENVAFSSLKAEVQVRTVLQHAWAALDRKLRYNNEEDIPREVKRKLFRVSALLEIADENFSEVDRLVGVLRARYETDIRMGNLSQEINLDSIEIFMRDSEAVGSLVEEFNKHYKVVKIDREALSQPLTLRSVSNLVMAVHLLGLKTIGELNELVIKFLKTAKEVITALKKESSSDTFTTAGAIRLALVYTVPAESSARILVQVPFNGTLNRVIFKTLHPEMAKKINFDSLVKIAAGLAAGRSDVSREEFAMMVSVASERTGAGAESNPLDHGGPSAPTKSKTKK